MIADDAIRSLCKTKTIFKKRKNIDLHLRQSFHTTAHEKAVGR